MKSGKKVKRKTKVTAKTKTKKPKKTPQKTKDSKALFVNPDVVFREEGKEALLFDPNTGSIKVLNQVGKLIWKMLNGKNSKKDVLNKLTKKFKEVDPKRLSKDLNEFLKNLEKFGYFPS